MLKVDEVFTKKGTVVPFNASPFDTIEELVAAFDKPEELFIVTYAPDNQAVGHVRDREWIELKRRITDKYIAMRGEYGKLSLEDAQWVSQQVERELTEMN